MSVKQEIKDIIGQSVASYNRANWMLKKEVKDLEFQEEYQNRIIHCMVGEVDDNYVEAPATDAPVVKLDYSHDGLVKLTSIKGKTILVDASGNVTTTPGEGCRLVSAGEAEDNKLIILSKNPNYFLGGVHIGKVWSTPSQVGSQWSPSHLVANKLYNATDIFEIFPNTEYTMSLDNKLLHGNIKFFDKDKKYIKDFFNHPIISPSNARYCTAHYSSATLGNGANILVQIGKTMTKYVPNQQHKSEILLKEPLRSLPNGICDEIVGNKLITRLGVINGANGFSKNNIKSDTNGSRFVVKVDKAKQVKNIVVSCNSMPFEIKSSSFQQEGFYITTDEFTMNNSINIRLLEDLTLKEFKDRYINLEIIYELAEPIIEELPNAITLQCFDDTTMYIENSITPFVTYGYNCYIPYKAEISKQQKQITYNQNNLDEFIVPYLGDIELQMKGL